MPIYNIWFVANLSFHFVDCNAIIDDVTNKTEKCVFPFDHDDVDYYTCINKNSDNPWCKTENKNKGICHSGCPGDFNSTYYLDKTQKMFWQRYSLFH